MTGKEKLKQRNKRLKILGLISLISFITYSISYVSESKSSLFLLNISALVFGVSFISFLVYLIFTDIGKSVLYEDEQLNKFNISEADKKDGYEFEKYLAKFFRSINIAVEELPLSNDYGADLIITVNGKKIIVQAKKYGVNNKVSIDAIREAATSKDFYKGDSSVVITTSFFTKNAITLADGIGVNLIDRNALIRMFQEERLLII